MEILEFKYITTKDISDNELFNDGHAWSRCYEYPLVLNYMNELLSKESTIHNSSWGFAGIHITFKNELDRQFQKVLHSDIKSSNLDKTTVYDIKKQSPEFLTNRFDCVLNISTLEEVGGDHCEIFQNLYSQVKKGGYFIFTFDYPGLQLERMEEFLGQKIKKEDPLLHGGNSIVPNSKYIHLNCGIVVVKKS